MMDGIKLELCMAESIATRIPLWQVQEYDRLTWTGYIDASEDAPHNGNPFAQVASSCFVGSAAVLITSVVSRFQL